MRSCCGVISTGRSTPWRCCGGRVLWRPGPACGSPLASELPQTSEVQAGHSAALRSNSMLLTLSLSGRVRGRARRMTRQPLLAIAGVRGLVCLVIRARITFGLWGQEAEGAEGACGRSAGLEGRAGRVCSCQLFLQARRLVIPWSQIGKAWIDFTQRMLSQVHGTHSSDKVRRCNATRWRFAEGHAEWLFTVALCERKCSQIAQQSVSQRPRPAADGDTELDSS
jgi:hypothetical protein